MVANLILVIWTDQYNNTYYHSINEKPFNTDYFALTEKSETNPKAKYKTTKYKITNYKTIFRKGYTGHWSREVFIIDSVLKTNSWTYKLKI